MTPSSLGLGAPVAGDAVGQSSGVLAGDEDAPDHEVELDGVEDAVSVVGLLGDCGKGLGLLVVAVVACTTIGGRTACRTARVICEYRWFVTTHWVMMAYLMAMMAGCLLLFVWVHFGWCRAKLSLGRRQGSSEDKTVYWPVSNECVPQQQKQVLYDDADTVVVKTEAKSVQGSEGPERGF